MNKYMLKKEIEPHTEHYVACTDEEDIEIVVSPMCRPGVAK
jgi:hypothetical protein